MIPRFTPIALTFMLAIVLAGCSLFGPRITREMRRTPDYRAGYQDGCASAPGPDANKRNGFDQVKDEDAFRTRKNYRLGWNAGYSACRTYTPQGQPHPYAGPIGDQNPGNGGIPRY
jgi:hypothetical protein